MTVCTSHAVDLQRHSRQEVRAQFDAGRISSDGGALLLREVDGSLGIIKQVARCFQDHRRADRIEHTLEELLRQRIFGLALGYEDIADHDMLRSDSVLALACGKQDVLGQDRERASDRGNPLAAHATLHRLELARPCEDSDGRQSEVRGDNKITFSRDFGDYLFIDLYAQLCQDAIPKQVILDLDATDSTIHGNQEGKWFNTYYDSHCYTPLYIFTDTGHVVWSELQTCDESPSRNSVHAVSMIVERLRARPGWESVRFIVRGDSGFCRDDLMTWCEAHDVGFILGLATNSRLESEIASELKWNLTVAKRDNEAQVSFHSFCYRTRKTWSAERFVAAKAEALPARCDDGNKEAKANPRFVVTNLNEMLRISDPEELYRHWYCPRGEMENRIKEQQLCLFADRVSTSWMWSNQIRQWFSTIAYVLMHALRTIGLKGTDRATAQCSTIRSYLLKIGATIRVTTRRIWVHLSGGHPAEPLFRKVAARFKQLC
jgi:hypothetical protein